MLPRISRRDFCNEEYYFHHCNHALFSMTENHFSFNPDFFPYRRKRKVLVVEDDEFTHGIIGHYLKSFGSEIYIASNGIEAIEIVNQITDIDLILMDIHMPRMDGLTACSMIKQNHPDIPIIIETACGRELNQDRIIKSGCVNLLRKPFSRQDFLSVVGAFLTVDME